LVLFAKKDLVGKVVGGDTIASVAQRTSSVSLCVEDSSKRGLQDEAVGKRFKLRLADSEDRRSSASFLIQRRYAWRGYQVDKIQTEEPSRITLAAHDDDGTAGTISVGLDSRDGLFVDELYRAEANRLRRDSRHLCEFTKLAVENGLRSRPLLAALFHLAFIYARRIYKCTDLLIEVNPRHVSFYRRMLGFEQFGQQRLDPRVNAPAVLLRLPLAHPETEIARYGGRSDLYRRVRSLYPYFYSQREQTGIERRLRELG